jgi:hypothetical protein
VGLANAMASGASSTMPTAAAFESSPFNVIAKDG